MAESQSVTVHEMAQAVAPTADTKVTVTSGAGPYIELVGDTIQSAYLSPRDARRIGQALIDAGWQADRSNESMKPGIPWRGSDGVEID